MMSIAQRWLPERAMVAAAGSSFAALEVLAAVTHHTLSVVTRLRLDAAALFAPAPVAEGRLGRPRNKLQRLPKLARAHLGVQTQRQWSKRAIARTTPLLLGLFSLMTLIADRLITDQAIPRPWYRKAQPIFSDTSPGAPAPLERPDFCTSQPETDLQKTPRSLQVHLTELLCYAA